jgi:hypothetical protein
MHYQWLSQAYIVYPWLYRTPRPISHTLYRMGVFFVILIFFSEVHLFLTVDIRYGFFPIKSTFLIAFCSRNGFLSQKWTCPSKGVMNILQKGTIWGTVCFILLFDGTLQYLNRTNRSGLSFWLQWKLHFLERQWW